MFDLSPFKILILAVIALVVFGPDQLPKMAAQAGRALRDVRRLAEGARTDLQQHLPEEFKEFDINELNPKYFVRKHLLDEAGGAGLSGSAAAAAAASPAASAAEPGLQPGENPPYDDEAT